MVDGFSGYYAMRLSRESRPLTAFLTPFGVHVWNVLPSGLTNGPPKKRRLVEKVYGDLPRSHSFVDDTGLGHHDEASIVPDLRQLLERARAAKLKIKPTKVFIGHRRLDFLGHLLSKHGISHDAAKIQKVMQFQKPRDKQQLH